MSEDKPNLGRLLSERIADSLKSGGRMQNAEVTVETKKHARMHCGHRATVLDENARTLHCKECGSELDPIGVLIAYARQSKTAEWHRKQIHLELKKLEELKKEERRVKQRISSAKKRAEKVPTLAAVRLIGALIRCVNALRFELRGAIPKRAQKELDEAKRLSELCGSDDLRI